MDLGATVCTRKSLYVYTANATTLSGLSTRFRTGTAIQKVKKPVPVRTADVVVIQSGDEWFGNSVQGTWVMGRIVLSADH